MKLFTWTVLDTENRVYKIQALAESEDQAKQLVVERYKNSAFLGAMQRAMQDPPRAQNGPLVWVNSVDGEFIG